MPAGFERCRNNGGKIRTVTGPNKQYGLETNQYRPICILNEKVYPGEVHTKQRQGKSYMTR